MEEEKKGTAKRLDTGKARFDLIPPILNEEVAKILTMGAAKYGDSNWRGGMKWSRCIGSLKRHLHQFESGVDYDDESKELHLSHVIVNAMFLLQYYKDHPNLDDRQHKYLSHPKIGLDIDEVLCDFVGAYCEKFNLTVPNFWNFHSNSKEIFATLKDDKDFWLNLKPKIKCTDLPFEPHCYITSRSINPDWTAEWLYKNGFPSVPIYSVPFNTSKLDVAKKSGLDVFVDDKFETFVELNKNSIMCYLFDTAHNRKYNVGHKRIYSLSEIK